MNRMNLFDADEKLIHYEGELGIFDYDPEEFEVRYFFGEMYLHYCGMGKSVNLPKGCTSTRLMFNECILPAGFSLGPNFDTSEVTNMVYMFKDCELPAGFSFGDRFITSKVINMRTMFYRCSMPEGLSLGENFDTSSVTDMYAMFAFCKMPKNFTLGDKFEICNARRLDDMFRDCTYGGFDIADYLGVRDEADTVSKLCKPRES